MINESAVPERVRRRRWPWLVAGALVAAIAVGVVLFLTLRTDEKHTASYKTGYGSGVSLATAPLDSLPVRTQSEIASSCAKALDDLHALASVLGPSASVAGPTVEIKTKDIKRTAYLHGCKAGVLSVVAPGGHPKQ